MIELTPRRLGSPGRTNITEAMAKKSAIYGEFIITIEDSNKVRVCKIYDNVLGSLREIAAQKDFTIDPKWNTQETGRRIVKEFGNGTMAEIGEYIVNRRPTGQIETYRTYGDGKGMAVLREISALVGFEIDPKWNTQQTGSKLVDFINANK